MELEENERTLFGLSRDSKGLAISYGEPSGFCTTIPHLRSLPRQKQAAARSRLRRPARRDDRGRRGFFDDQGTFRRPSFA